MKSIFVLDYGAGNVLSLINSLKEIGIQVEFIKEIEDFKRAKVGSKERVLERELAEHAGEGGKEGGLSSLRDILKSNLSLGIENHISWCWVVWGRNGPFARHELF